MKTAKQKGECDTPEENLFENRGNEHGHARKVDQYPCGNLFVDKQADNGLGRQREAHEGEKCQVYHARSNDQRNGSKVRLNGQL